MNPNVKNTRIVNSSSGGQISAICLAALAIYSIVYIDGDGKAAYPTTSADRLDLAVVKDGTDAAGDHAALNLIGKGETKTVVAAAPITAGAKVYVDVAGGVGRVKELAAEPVAGTYVLVGIARSAATAAGEQISLNDAACPQVLVIEEEVQPSGSEPA